MNLDYTRDYDCIRAFDDDRIGFCMWQTANVYYVMYDSQTIPLHNLPLIVSLEIECLIGDIRF